MLLCFSGAAHDAQGTLRYSIRMWVEVHGRQLPTLSSHWSARKADVPFNISIAVAESRKDEGVKTVANQFRRILC